MRKWGERVRGCMQVCAGVCHCASAPSPIILLTPTRRNFPTHALHRAHARSLSQPFLQNGVPLHVVETLDTCIISIKGT